MTFEASTHDDHGRHHAPPQGDPYWLQWVQPPTVIAIVVSAATVYGAGVIQAERIDAMRGRIEQIERDYQRRDVLAEQLRSIDARLYQIEVKLGNGGVGSAR